MKTDNQNFTIMKYKRGRCVICKNDNHRASFSRQLKSRKHLEFRKYGK